jgi:hypothetical protein
MKPLFMLDGILYFFSIDTPCDAAATDDDDDDDCGLLFIAVFDW